MSGNSSSFTIDNIPFGVISYGEKAHRCATALGDEAIDLHELGQSGFFKDGKVNEALLNLACQLAATFTKWKTFTESYPRLQPFQKRKIQPNLSIFAALPSSTRTAARQEIIDGIKSQKIQKEHFIPLSETTMHLPMPIPGYTDFFCSLEHCKNCAPMTNAEVSKNFFLAPCAYNGRASSVLPSPHAVRRPKGVYWNADKTNAVYGPSQLIDYELEMGYIVSQPVAYGETVDIADAGEHIFGFVLLNDWSSRDIQVFEMTPLGPFNSKSFGTTISPWVITLDALAPFACAPKHQTTPFPHLTPPDFARSTFDIKLAVHLVRNGHAYPTCSSNLRYLYWTPYQQLTHHASAMCGLRTGDLMGTGTVSGDAVDGRGAKYELGCLFEATLHASAPYCFDDGESLGYLLDGDEIVLTAHCEDAAGNSVLGFGECRGKLHPSKD